MHFVQVQRLLLQFMLKQCETFQYEFEALKVATSFEQNGHSQRPLNLSKARDSNNNFDGVYTCSIARWVSFDFHKRTYIFQFIFFPWRLDATRLRTDSIRLVDFIHSPNGRMDYALRCMNSVGIASAFRFCEKYHGTLRLLASVKLYTVAETDCRRTAAHLTHYQSFTLHAFTPVILLCAATSKLSVATQHFRCCLFICQALAARTTQTNFNTEHDKYTYTGSQ